ncbi:MAG: DUF2804 domain-containing protein [Treponema sp.]|nr:DUF2804 domain-containing protein [Treponema sp.]MCL2237237.1 DUF2804 domain-containing protein [Treponema sp.]
MYTREILPPIASPIEDGIPVIGTWNKAFDRVDLQEIRNPYGYYMPKWARDTRIKEWQSYSAHTEEYSLEALFCNVKLYRMAQVILFDKKNEKKFIFRKIVPLSGWQLPVSLANASVDSHSSHFFFRIHNWLDADTIRLDINIEATRKRPSFTAHLAYNLNSQDVTPMAVSLAITQRRSMYAYKTLAPVRGDMVFGGLHIALMQDTCSGFFCDYKGYFPYRMQTKICSAIGFDEENRRFGFHIAENQTRESNKNNENALWHNGKLTPLPPVLITMPNGPDDTWVIQDVEGMVDLTFTPKDFSNSRAKLVFTRADFNAPLGYYNGVLLNSDGEKIQIKNLFGMGENLYLRV